MDNYPLGAGEDPSAPFNIEEKEYTFRYSISSTINVKMSKKAFEDWELAKELVERELTSIYGKDIEIESID